MLICSSVGSTTCFASAADFAGAFFADFLAGAFFAAALLLVFLAALFFVAGLAAAGAVSSGATALVTGCSSLTAFVSSVFFFLATVGWVCRTPIQSGGAVCKRIFANQLRARRVCAYAAPVRHFIFRWAITTVAVMAASAFIRGIRYDTIGSLIAAALLLGILNAFVRPVLLILSAPLILFSLGFFILIVNALLLYWVPTFVAGFHVDSFGTAFWGAIIIGLISWLLSAFFRGSDGRVHVLTHHTQIKRVQGRVIEP